MNTMAMVAEQEPLVSSSDLSEAVRSTAMLADVSIGKWSASRSDKRIMDEAKAKAGAVGDVGRAVVNLMAGADALLKETRSTFDVVRTVHRSLTLPWVADPHAQRDEGARLLTTMLFDKYMTEMSKAKRDAMASLDKFIDNYPTAMAQARVNLGGLVTDEDYPTADQVRAKFRVSFDFQPIPAGTQFRGLPEQTMGKLAKQLQRRQERMVMAAQTSMWEQASERVGKVVERLSNPENKFHDSTIEAVRELVELMPGWNVAGDGRVTEIVEDISRMISGVTSKTLRKDANARLTTSQQGQAIAEKMRAWGL